MEGYIVLVNGTNYCYDFHCKFQNSQDLYSAEITSEQQPIMIVSERNQNACYSEVAKYILDRGKIISIMPLSENHKTQIFRTYIRIEEINRLLARIRRSFKISVL